MATNHMPDIMVAAMDTIGEPATTHDKIKNHIICHHQNSFFFKFGIVHLLKL